MQNLKLSTTSVCALAFAALLASAPAFAEKPAGVGGGKNDKSSKHEERGDDHGGGKGEKGSRHEERDDDHGGSHGHQDGDRDRSGSGLSVSVGFNDEQRTWMRNYYSDHVRSGHCPPGLAKKNNGCMPPGQAKKWAVGQPLPPDVIFYDLPPEIVIHLGTPPPLHRFVRVASDILLIAAGTGMVVDAIEDLGNL